MVQLPRASEQNEKQCEHELMGSLSGRNRILFLLLDKSSAFDKRTRGRILRA